MSKKSLYLCLSLAACWGCSRSNAEGGAPKGGAADATARPVPVAAAAAARRDVPIYLDGLGNVTAFYTVTVRTQVDGRLEKVLFREGQAVKKGDVLAQVDPRPFESQLHQAEGALARDSSLLQDNRLNLERNTKLKEQNLVAQQAVDDLHAQVGQYEGAVRVDQAQIDNARLQMEYARIVSPIDGVTGIRQVDPGNIVHPADPGGIVVVTQVDPIAVIFTLPQDDLHRIAEQQQHGELAVEAYTGDGSTKLGEGKLAVIDNQINQATATVRLKAIFPNPQRLLWPNQFVKARLLLTVRKDALVVPVTAVQRGPHGTFAYVVKPDQTVADQAIDVEVNAGELAILRSGVEPGQQVVTDGQNQIRPGSKVTVRGQGEGKGGGDSAPPTGAPGQAGRRRP